MILGIGTVVEDHVVLLNEYPQANTKASIATHWRQVGGPVPVALSIAGFFGSSTSFAGRWGDDDIGNRIAHTLTARDIDILLCQQKRGWRSGFAHVWCDQAKGTRTIAFDRGAFDSNTTFDWDPGLLSRCLLLHSDGTEASTVIQAARIIKEHGGRVVLDAGSVKPGLDDLLPMVDILIASELFRTSYLGSPSPNSKELLSLGVPDVITTDGANGCCWYYEDNVIEQPALNVDVVDSNGAGDIFSGALLYSLSRSNDRRTCLEFANAVAGLSCERKGNYPPPSMQLIQKHVDWQLEQ